VAREERRLKAISAEAAEREKKAQTRMQEEAFALRLQVQDTLSDRLRVAGTDQTSMHV